MSDEVKLLPCPLTDALTDARNNILSLLGAFRDEMPSVAVKLFQAQAKQIDAAIAAWNTRAIEATRPTDEVVERVATLRKSLETERIVTRAQRHEIDHLRKALVEHNDRLRSAHSIAKREGSGTNWAGFTATAGKTLKDWHALTNEARAAIAAMKDAAHD